MGYHHSTRLIWCECVESSFPGQETPSFTMPHHGKTYILCHHQCHLFPREQLRQVAVALLALPLCLPSRYVPLMKAKYFRAWTFPQVLTWISTSAQEQVSTAMRPPFFPFFFFWDRSGTHSLPCGAMGQVGLLYWPWPGGSACLPCAARTSCTMHVPAPLPGNSDSVSITSTTSGRKPCPWHKVINVYGRKMVS